MTFQIARRLCSAHSRHANKPRSEVPTMLGLAVHAFASNDIRKQVPINAFCRVAAFVHSIAKLNHDITSRTCV